VRWQEQALGDGPSGDRQQKPEYAEDDKAVGAEELTVQAGKKAKASGAEGTQAAYAKNRGPGAIGLGLDAHLLEISPLMHELLPCMIPNPRPGHV
jgi:hypothetical protein